MIVVCKKYHTDTLVKELGINNVNSNNPTYIPIDDLFETIVKSHNNFIKSVGLGMSEEDQNPPYLYWTPKLHTIKDGLMKYCNTKTSRNSVNNMWILKNSISLLSLDQPAFKKKDGSAKYTHIKVTDQKGTSLMI